MTGPTSGRTPPAYLALFALLYATQGVVISYFFNFNAAYMKAAGVGDGAIGVAQSIALIPLILRFLGGPLSDRVNVFGFGYRKPYIFIGLALQGVGMYCLTRVDPAARLAVFTAFAVLAVLGLSLYDTATDGMILDTIPAERRSRTQVLFVASKFLGAMAASTGFGVWLKETGNGPGRGDGVLWACAGLGIIPMLVALSLLERPRAEGVEEFRWEALGVLIRPRSIVLLIFGTLYSIAAYAVELNLSPFYRSLTFNDRDVGVFAAVRYVGRAFGAVALGMLAPRIGRRAVLILGVVGLSLATLGQATVLGPGHGSRGLLSAGSLALGFGLAVGWCDALFYILAMEASDPRMAASTCALFMSVTNLSVLGGGFFAQVETRAGRYSVAFAATAALALFALILTPPLARPFRAADPLPSDG